MFSLVLLSLSFLVFTAHGIVFGEVEEVGGESRCGIVDSLLMGVRHAQQAETPQDSANRVLLLIDTYQFSEYCIQGRCTTDVGDLIQQFSRESRVLKDMTFTNVRSEYGNSWAQSILTTTIVDICGVTYEPITTRYSFYCNGEQGRATGIHVIYDEIPFTVIQRQLKECENKMNQNIEGTSEEEADMEDTLPEQQNTGPLPLQPGDFQDAPISELDDSPTLPIPQTPEPIPGNEW